MGQQITAGILLAPTASKEVVMEQIKWCAEETRKNPDIYYYVRVMSQEEWDERKRRKEAK